MSQPFGFLSSEHHAASRDHPYITAYFWIFLNHPPTLYVSIQGCRKRGGLGGFTPPPPIFGQTVNPISTRGADYAHHSTSSPLGFSDHATALSINTALNVSKNDHLLTQPTQFFW